MEARIENVDGKNIYIIDEVFSQDEIEAFYEYVSDLPFRKKEKSTSYDEFPIFSSDFVPDKFETETYVGIKARELVNQFIEGAGNFKLFRAYINLSNYGDVEYPHFDCPADRNDITVLYYVNKSWHYKYGGETMFYSKKDSRIAVLPTPGRFVIFPGNIEHLGSIATRVCREPRLSLALKYFNIKN